MNWLRINPIPRVILGLLLLSSTATADVAVVDYSTQSLPILNEYLSNYGGRLDSIESIFAGSTILPISNGGTGAATAQAGINALLGTSVQGDILYYNGTNWVHLGYGTAGYFLKTNGVSANPAWDMVGNTSNVILSWLGVSEAATNQYGYYTGTSLAPNIGATTATYSYVGAYGTTERVILTGKFKKIAGISTVSIYGKIWTNDINFNRDAILKVDIGGQNNTITANHDNTPAWRAKTDIDVSGLTNGTVYDISISLYNEDGGYNSYCSGVILIAS